MTPAGSNRRRAGQGRADRQNTPAGPRRAPAPAPAPVGLSAADLAWARAAAASLSSARLDDDDDWAAGDSAGDRDSLTDVPGGVRLQKVLAGAGVGSRRYCEELIRAARVDVDGEIVRRLGARVDPQHQIIRVDGKRIPAREDLVYVALNKPAEALTTMSDARGRPTIADFLGDRAERLFHVGRLDYDTEGLMLLMNDGELAHRLAHPRYGVLKTCLADKAGPPPRDLAPHLTPAGRLAASMAMAARLRVVA